VQYPRRAPSRAAIRGRYPVPALDDRIGKDLPQHAKLRGTRTGQTGQSDQRLPQCPPTGPAPGIVTQAGSLSKDLTFTGRQVGPRDDQITCGVTGTTRPEVDHPREPAVLSKQVSFGAEILGQPHPVHIRGDIDGVARSQRRMDHRNG
jgi:hypothetical protein